MTYRLHRLPILLLLAALALAGALRADPKVASITLGAEVRGHGITLDEGRLCKTRVATMQERECRATDEENDQYYLRSKVGPGLAPPGSWPVRVTVEHYGPDCGGPPLYYRSSDADLLAAGREQRVSLGEEGACLTRLGLIRSAWHTSVLDLPDAGFDQDGWTFAISSEAWLPGREDAYVSSVKVELGGVVLTAEPLVVPNDGEARLSAKVIGPEGEELKGPVEFKADVGEIKPEPDGLSARYVPPPLDSETWQEKPQVIEGGIQARDGAEAIAQDGRPVRPTKLFLTAHLTAKFGDRIGRATVVIARDRGPLVSAEAKLSEFERPDTWEVTKHLTAFSSPQWSISDEQAHAGATSGRLSYQFREPMMVGEAASLNLTAPNPLPGVPLSMSLWVFGDGSGNQLKAWISNGKGGARRVELGYLDFTGWRKLTAALAPPATADAEFPGSSQVFEALSLEAAVWRPEHKPSGTIYLDDLSFTFVVPEAKSLELSVETAPSTVFERPRDPVEVRLMVRNLVPIPRTGLQVACTVKNDDGETIKEFSQTLDLAASEVKTLAFAVIPPKIGTYHPEAKLTGAGFSLESSTAFSVGLPSG